MKEDTGEAARRYQTVESYIGQTGTDKPKHRRLSIQQDQSTIKMIGVGIHTICSVMKYIRTI
jgi:hypothetical protein